mmetsp:Transcript_29006/g.93846  ORF Transcript_29006/g.93846 Transcript_29006/m.93846 type:complete len:209 (+) Transcript_29006:425-1051(+)
MVRPATSVSLHASTAFWACAAVSNSATPMPLKRPVSRSSIHLMDVTVPADAKWLVSAASSMDQDRFVQKTDLTSPSPAGAGAAFSSAGAAAASSLAGAASSFSAAASLAAFLAAFLAFLAAFASASDISTSLDGVASSALSFLAFFAGVGDSTFSPSASFFAFFAAFSSTSSPTPASAALRAFFSALSAFFSSLVIVDSPMVAMRLGW